MGEWIKCSEKMPQEYDYVLVCANNQGTDEPKPISIACWNGEDWDFLDGMSRGATYGAYLDIGYPMTNFDIKVWMSLPKPPKE